MADKAIGVHLKDWHIVQGVRTGNSPWSPIAIAQVPVKEPAPSAPTIESVTAPEASAGVLEIKVNLPETNADGTALARAELVRLRLHHSTSPGVDESDPYVDFPPSETLLWAPNDTVTHYVRVRVQDSHGLWSELSNEASGQANAAPVPPQEDSGLWAHRLGVESIFTNDSPDPGYVSWSNVVLYWRDNKYEIADGSTNKKYIWWDYSVSTTTFQTSDTRPELELEDVIIGYNDNGTWRLMCYQPTVMADYVRAGVLQSSNWGATTGSQLDLDNGTLKLGGSDSPKFQVDADGVLHATGAVISGALTAGPGSSIDGVYIEDATITDAKIASLSADKITTGTLDASQVNVINLNADNITAGTLTGRTVQTAVSGLRARMITSGTHAHSFAIEKDSDILALMSGTTDGESFLDLAYFGNGRVALQGLSDGGKILLFGTNPAIEYHSAGYIQGLSLIDPIFINNACLETVTGRFSYSGAQIFSGNCPTSWTDRDLSSYVGSRRALVFLKIKNNAGIDKAYAFRPNGDTDEYTQPADYPHSSKCVVKPGECGTVWVMTDASGVIEWKSGSSTSTTMWLLAYIT